MFILKLKLLSTDILRYCCNKEPTPCRVSQSEKLKKENLEAVDEYEKPRLYGNKSFSSAFLCCPGSSRHSFYKTAFYIP